MSLAATRARVEEVRAGGGELFAVALVQLAELEPLFGHRQTVVRSLLEQAATVLDTVKVPALEGRVLLRLAHIKMLETDLEGAEQLAARARDRLDGTGDVERVDEAICVLARASIRRRQLDAAELLLVELSSLEPEAREGTDPGLTARRFAADLALAWAELALERRNFKEAEDRLEVLWSCIADDDDLLEQQFACKQALAAIAMATGDVARACYPLRDLVTMTKKIDAVEDELEARIALAGALVQRDDQAGREEAERHLQITRDTAQEHDLDSMHMAALVGQAGLLAKKGQTQAALARCIEIANTAVAKKDLPRYASAVALMSSIYEQKGDLSSAYRTFAEANATLRETIGEAAKDLIVPHLAAFADRIGHAKFREVADRVNQAALAKQSFGKN